jgi:AGZA family xanthine/uracil permease-like MFS transporter
MADSISGFVAIIMMPFTYSIANGIMFGFLSYVLIKTMTGKVKEVHPIMWVCFALFVARICTLILG